MQILCTAVVPWLAQLLVKTMLIVGSKAVRTLIVKITEEDNVVAPRHPAILGLNFMLKDKIKARVYIFLKIFVLAHKEIAYFPPMLRMLMLLVQSLKKI